MHDLAPCRPDTRDGCPPPSDVTMERAEQRASTPSWPVQDLPHGAETVIGEQAISSARAVLAFSGGAAHGHDAAAFELAELDAYLDTVVRPVIEAGPVVR